MDITKEEKRYRKELVQKSYKYLCDNFHKFNESNQIRVALQIVSKDMPTHLEHSGEVEFKGLLEECLRRSKNV